MKRHFKIGLFILCIAFIISCAKKTPEDYMLEANDLIKNKNIIGAKYKLKEAIKKFPDNPAILPAYKLLSECDASLGDYQEQRNSLQVIIDKAGLKTQQGVEALADKVKSYEYEKKYDEAIKELEEAKKSMGADHPLIVSMQLKLAALYSKVENTKKTDEIFAQLKKDHSNEEETLLKITASLGQYKQSQKDLKGEIDAYKYYIEKFPDNEKAALYKALIGKLYNELKDTTQSAKYFAESLAQFDKLIEKSLEADEKAMLLWFKSQAYDFQKETEKAIDLCKQIVKEYKESPVSRQAIYFAIDMGLKNGKDDIIIKWLTELRDEAKDPKEKENYDKAITDIKNIRLKKDDKTTTKSADLKTTDTKTSDVVKKGK